MNRTITTEELQESPGRYLTSIRTNGECYIITSNGSAEAALVPLSVLQIYEQNRARLGYLWNKIAESAEGELSEDEAMNLANEEIAAYRAEKRAKRAQQ